MDKRYEPLKEYGRVNKKPKLEIIVNKGRPNQSLSAPGLFRNEAKTRSPPKSSPDDFWDDDDDEVILLASQVVEKEIPREQIPSTQSMDFTFSEFVPNAKVTSTQKLFAHDVEVFSELLDDDWGMDNIPEPQPVFKVPAAFPVKRPHNETERIATQTERPFSDLTKSVPLTLSQAPPAKGIPQQQPHSSLISLSQPNSNSRPTNREKAHECQIQFLQKRADTLKKENIKIAKELDEFKNKMESKDGEVSLLRDEIRHLKQQIQATHRDKMQSTGAAKEEYKNKINELSKQLEAQQTVLEFKAMEISKLKMNHADETMRFDHTMRENLNESIPHQSNIKVTSPNRRFQIQLQSCRLLNVEMPVTFNIPIDIFNHSTEKGNSKFRKDVFQREMERLQFQLSRLQYVSLMKVDQKSELATSVIDSATSVIAEFWTYVHSLEYNKHCQSLPYHAYDISKESRAENNCSLFQAEVMFLGEKTVNLRRYIAGLSVVCRMVPEAGASLFTIHHNQYLLIQIIIDGLNKLGFSHEIRHHFGVVESFALLLGVLWNNHINEESHQEQLISLLKTLIFCRPSAWAIKYITQCLLKMPASVRAHLCSNSRPQTFSASQSTYKFAPESCILQVYAGLLEISFPDHQELNGSQFRLLSEICYNHLIFFTNCFPDPPNFVSDILPLDVDLEEEGVVLSQRAGTAVRCQCYIIMCSSIIKLLYQVIEQWQSMEEQKELQLIANLSKVGVRLVHTIYIRYYMTKLFDHKGYLTRHYLYFICKYWLNSVDLLQFTETHKEALNQLAGSHIIEINISPMERSLMKVDRDLDRWYTHSGDTKPEVVGSPNTNGQQMDLTKLRVLKKTCDPGIFFKRY